jgi:hypothetical protein
LIIDLCCDSAVTEKYKIEGDRQNVELELENFRVQTPNKKNPRLFAQSGTRILKYERINEKP